MPKKLSEQELNEFRLVAERGDGNSLIKRLLGHIEAVTEELTIERQQKEMRHAAWLEELQKREAALANEKRKVSKLAPLGWDLQKAIWETIPMGQYAGMDMVDVVRTELTARGEAILYLKNALYSIWEKRGFKPAEGGLIADLAIEVARKALSINENEA